MTLHHFTQAEFDALPMVNGYRECPIGDYSAIRSFGEQCSFGGGCSFDERCRFGGWCSFDEQCSLEGGHKCRTYNPYFAVDRIGSILRKAYFFDFQDGLYIRAGCFFGSEAAFLAKLRADKNDHKMAIYTAALALAKLHLGIEVTP